MTLITRIQRYILTRFFLNLLLVTISVLAIYIVIDYVGKIRKFAEIPIATVGYYYIFMIPYILNLIISIIMLLTAMLTMGSLAKNSEITAMRAAGLSIFYITRPVLYFALFLTLLNITFNETLLPKANRLREKMYRTIIKKLPEREPAVRAGFLYQAGNEVILHFKGRFDSRSGRGEEVDIEFYRDGKLYKRVTCRALEWRDRHWTAVDGVERTFLPDSILSKPFAVMDRLPAEIREKPGDILKEKLLPEEMTFLELRQYIENLKRAGENPFAINKLRADLHYKVSLPFILFIGVVFGVSLTVRAGRRGVARVFGIGLLVGFVYYFLVNLGLGLGQSGNLHPVLGAWIGNLIFFPIALAYFIKVTKFE